MSNNNQIWRSQCESKQQRYQIQKNHTQYRQNFEYNAKLACASAKSQNESSQHIFPFYDRFPVAKNFLLKAT